MVKKINFIYGTEKHEKLFANLFLDYIDGVVVTGIAKDAIALYSDRDKIVKNGMIKDIYRNYEQVQKDNEELEDYMVSLLEYKNVYRMARRFYREFKQDEKRICRDLTDGKELSERTKESYIKNLVGMEFLENKVFAFNADETIIDEYKISPIFDKNKVLKILISAEKFQKTQ